MKFGRGQQIWAPPHTRLLFFLVFRVVIKDRCVQPIKFAVVRSIMDSTRRAIARRHLTRCTCTSGFQGWLKRACRSSPPIEDEEGHRCRYEQRACAARAT